MISLEKLKLESSNFVHRYIISSPSLQTTFKGALSGLRDTFLNFDTRNHISRTTEAIVATFCMQIEYIKCLAFDDRLLPNWRGQSHVTGFLNFAPIISLESVKLRTSNLVC